MNFSLTTNFQKKAHKLFKKDSQLRKVLAKQFILFKQDHLHPSLKLHKLKGKRSEQYAIWIIGDLRITFVLMNDEILLTDLITHDEY